MRAASQGDACAGGVRLVPASWSSIAVRGEVAEALRVPETRGLPRYAGLPGSVTGAMAWDARHNLHSVHRRTPCQAASVGGLSNQELKRTPGRVAWGARVCLGGGQAPLNSYCFCAREGRMGMPRSFSSRRLRCSQVYLEQSGDHGSKYQG